MSRLEASWPDGRSFQQRSGTIASVDLSGFTRISERLASLGRAGAEEVTAAVNSIFGRLIDAAFEEGGDIINFGGDAVLVWFEGDAGPRAARALALMQVIIAGTGRVDTPAGPVRIRMSAGAAAGAFCFASIARASNGLAVLGPDCSRALQLEATASPGQTFVDASIADSLDAAWTRRHEDGSARLVHRRILGPTADAPIGPGSPAHVDPGEHRLATVGFITVRGWDLLVARGDATTAVNRLREIVRTLDNVCAEYELTWMNPDAIPNGTKFLLVGGAHLVHEDDEDRMLLAMNRLIDRPDIRAGLHRGAVFVGDLGHQDRHVETLMGDNVNLAARVMSRAEGGQVLATTEMLGRSHLDLELEAIEPFMAKGKSQPVHAAVVIDVSTARSEHPHAAPRPLIGRHEELARLTTAFDGPAGGGFIHVVGEGGVGKSALVDATFGSSGRRVAEGRASPFESATAYAAARPMVLSALGLSGADGTLVASTVRELAPPGLRQRLALLGPILGVAMAETETTRSIDPEFRTDRSHDAVVELLDAHLGSEPMAFWLDDSHLADEASVELVDALRRASATRPWWVITSGREHDPRVGDGATITVGPLDATASRRVALEASGSADLPDERLEAMVERCGGSPFFLVALVEAWRAGKDDLPESVERMLSGRIDGLDPDRRRLVRAAAVAGREVDLAILAAVLDEPDAARPGRWRDLDDLVEVSAGSVSFTHDLVREAAYESLAMRRRRALHRRLAEVLVAGGTTDSAVLAHHWSEAHDHPEAWRWSNRAATEAEERFAIAEAADLLERALRSARGASASSDELAETWEHLGDLSERAGRLARAAEAYRQARRLHEPDARVELAVLAAKRATLEQRRARYRAALGCVTRGLQLVAGRSDRDAQRATSMLLMRASVIRHQQGRARQSVDLARAAVAVGTVDAVVDAKVKLALALALESVGHPDAESTSIDAERACRAISDWSGIANVLNNRGVTRYFGGDTVGGARDWELAIEAYEHCGDVNGAATTRNNLAEALIDQGRLAEAEEMITWARRVFAASGDEFAVACAASARATIATRQGRNDEALALLVEAERDLGRLGAHDYVLDARVRRAEYLIRTGDPTGALDLLRSLESQAAGGTDLISMLALRRLTSWALGQQGHLAEARRAADAHLADARSDGQLPEVALGLATIDALDRLDGIVTAPGLVVEREGLIAQLGIAWQAPIPVEPVAIVATPIPA